MKREKIISLLPIMLIPVYLVSDLVTKMLVVNHLPYHQYVPVLGKFAGFTYIFNTGVAFGLFSKLDPLVKNIVFTLITFGAIGFVIYLMQKTYKGMRLYRHACALILGGALGNVFDRIFGFMLYGDISLATGVNSGRTFKLFFGKVVDFVNMGFGYPHGKWRWPYFNVADACITVGLTILIILILFSKEKKTDKLIIEKNTD